MRLRETTLNLHTHTWIFSLNFFKYHVSCTDGKISVSIKIGFNFTFRFHRRPIQLFVFFPVSLSSLLRHPLQVLLGEPFVVITASSAGLVGWAFRRYYGILCRSCWVNLSSLLRHHLQVLLGVEVSSVARLGQLTKFFS